MKETDKYERVAQNIVCKSTPDLSVGLTFIPGLAAYLREQFPESVKIEKAEKLAARIGMDCIKPFADGWIFENNKATGLISDFIQTREAFENVEYCEWSKTNKHDGMSKPNCCATKHLNYGFNFCPFCGKPIRIKKPS
jgi:hypothetical protein